MLDDACCLPCFTFDDGAGRKIHLSPADLKEILLWAAKAKPTMPELLFLAGADTPLDPLVASVLEDMGEQVITPLLPIEKQNSLGIPFSINQTVVVDNLKQVVSQVEDIAGRPIILHVDRAEIPILAESLLAIQGSIGAVRLCLRNSHTLEDNDLQTYEQQLASIADIGLMKQATGAEGRFRILNLSVIGSGSRENGRCPAGTGFVAIGPDAHVYPCPAFYYAGQEYSFGSIRSMVKKPSTINWNQQQCGMCGSVQCPGCPFLESGDFPGKEQICRVYEAENRASKELLLRASKSGYLFECLQILKTRECADESQREGGESLTASRQVHDIRFDEFTDALKDLKLALESLIDESSGKSNYDRILSRWSELSEIPSTSQRNVFRRRVSEVLKEMRQLRYLHIADGQRHTVGKSLAMGGDKTQKPLVNRNNINSNRREE
jgi:radical SAM protein with 4Fe4S-binding SPASM domain